MSFSSCRGDDSACKDIFSCSGAGDVAAVDAFLAAGALVNAQDSSGRTALHWAVDREQQSLALHLLAHHKASPNVQDEEGQTPLHYASVCEHVDLVRLLLAHGADASLADKAGELPVDAARSNAELVACFAGSKI